MYKSISYSSVLPYLHNLQAVYLIDHCVAGCMTHYIPWEKLSSAEDIYVYLVRYLSHSDKCWMFCRKHPKQARSSKGTVWHNMVNWPTTMG